MWATSHSEELRHSFLSLSDPHSSRNLFDVCVLPFCCLELHRRYDCEQVEQKDYEALVTLAKVISWPDHICE